MNKNSETTTQMAVRLERRVRRKIFVCVLCEGIYADSPVTECDCANGARVFIEGIAEYVMPNVKVRGCAPGELTKEL